MSSDHEKRPDRGRMGRRDFLARLSLGAAGAAAGVGGANAEQQAKPAPAWEPPWLAAHRMRVQAVEAIRRTAKANGLNLVVVVTDTLRLDHVGAYGATRAKTPCLDELARQSVVFENAFADGLPTVPARRVFHTGKTVLPGAAWHALLPGQVSLAQILHAHGFWSGLVCDAYHYFGPGMNFHTGFDTWQWIRGQEIDPYLGGPREQFLPLLHMPPELWNPEYDWAMRTYMMNTQYFRTEDDYFAAQVVAASVRWLQQNAMNAPFMLWVEMFDPHEPWDAPPRFQKMYRDDYGFERFLFGCGFSPQDPLTGRNIDFARYLPVIRDLYAAEVTYVDHCVGRLLEAMEKLRLLDDTIVVFTSDHGTHLGEQGYILKQPALLNSLVMHLPLIIRHPDRSTAGKRVAGLVSAIDYAPIFCHMLGIDDQQQMDGRNAWDLVTGKADRLHDRVFTQFDEFVAVRNKKWHYFQHLSGQPRGAGPCLYDLEADPGEKTNVIAQHAQVAAELRAQLADRMQQKAPEVAPGPRAG